MTTVKLDADSRPGFLCEEIIPHYLEIITKYIFFSVTEYFT
jgi:hypothetical protein